jgi:hypothetical protein
MGRATLSLITGEPHVKTLSAPSEAVCDVGHISKHQYHYEFDELALSTNARAYPNRVYLAAGQRLP